MILLVFLAVLVALVATVVLHFPRSTIPAHLENHPARVIYNMIPQTIADDLFQLVLDTRTFPSNKDLRGQNQSASHTNEDIGEGIDINEDGSCSNALLVPNKAKTLCILPQRIDIGKHFIATGGIDGLKENLDVMIDRLTSFGSYNFPKNISDFPTVEALFNSEAFVGAAKAVCPAEKSFLDTFQFNFIMQVPGQTVAMHLDAPWFWGASRFQFPQWLLACMVFSNLFQDRFVDQVQVVGYLNRWNEDDIASFRGGEFVYYTNSTSLGTARPLPLAGTVVDGSKTLHAAKVYNPEVIVPHLHKDFDNDLVYLGEDGPDVRNGVWEIQANGKSLQRYRTKDIRIAIVYRARCFASPEEAQAFSSQQESDMLTLEGILSVFKEDILRRAKEQETFSQWAVGTLKHWLFTRKLFSGRPMFNPRLSGITGREQLDSMSRLELSWLIMDVYLFYPLPAASSAFIPFNYCVLPKLLPWTAPVLTYLC